MQKRTGSRAILSVSLKKEGNTLIIEEESIRLLLKSHFLAFYSMADDNMPDFSDRFAKRFKSVILYMHSREAQSTKTTLNRVLPDTIATREMALCY